MALLLALFPVVCCSSSPSWYISSRTCLPKSCFSSLKRFQNAYICRWFLGTLTTLNTRGTHIHEGPRYQATRKGVAKLSGDNFSCVVGLIRHPLGMHGGNGLGSDVYTLKVVDDLRDELSRDVYREVWAGGASGHW